MEPASGQLEPKKGWVRRKPRRSRPQRQLKLEAADGSRPVQVSCWVWLRGPRYIVTTIIGIVIILIVINIYIYINVSCIVIALLSTLSSFLLVLFSLFV